MIIRTMVHQRNRTILSWQGLFGDLALKGLGHASLGNFSTGQIVIELT